MSGTANHHFVHAMRGTPNPPCANCAERIRCAKKQLACAAFIGYLNLHIYPNADRTPSRGRYLKCFPTTDED